MKVAIMGAGLSGLSCAIMLEKNGISPVIFEKRGQVGDRFINGEILLSILTRPINDPLRYFSEEFQLYEIVENTRDFSHEMNRLRIGRGLCHVNYPTYAQSSYTIKH